MPLSINVGLSRKASKEYQSTGVSINVTAELDQSLLTRPAELQAQIEALYGQAENAIDRQVQAYASATTPEPAARLAQRYRSNGNGRHSNRNGNGARNGGAVTESQRRAIFAIADRAGVDPEQESQDQFGLAIDELSIQQASELIDLLKAGTRDPRPAPRR